MLIENTRERIIQQAGELFMQYGVRSVTMDDVAGAVTMSKKTLYQYFDNKDGLVSEVAKRYINLELEEFEEIRVLAKNAIHELIMVSMCIRKHIDKMNPCLLFDLQKYHAQAWDCYMEFKNEKVKGFLKQNLEEGINEGYFRAEINPEIISIFRAEQVQLASDSKLFPADRFEFKEVQLQVLDLFIHGLLTEKGKQTYQEYSQLETNSQSHTQSKNTI